MAESYGPQCATTHEPGESSADILIGTMRHPLLRILIALLIGVASPVCCCQVMALAGSACESGHAAAEADSCCHECPFDPASDDLEEVRSDAPLPSSSDCPSCPSCRGASVGKAAKSEANFPVFEEFWDTLATLSLAVLWELPALEAKCATVRPGWGDDPAFLKSNREALRWHCTLLV